MTRGSRAAALPPVRPSTGARIPVTRPVTGDVPSAALSWVSSPLRTEQSPSSVLPPATLVGFRSKLAGRIPFTVLRSEDTEEGSGLEFDPPVPEAAGTLLHREEADGSGPTRLCRKSVRLRLMDALARLPLPDAVGFPF